MHWLIPCFDACVPLSTAKIYVHVKKLAKKLVSTAAVETFLLPLFLMCGYDKRSFGQPRSLSEICEDE